MRWYQVDEAMWHNLVRLPVLTSSWFLLTCTPALFSPIIYSHNNPLSLFSSTINTTFKLSFSSITLIPFTKSSNPKNKKCTSLQEFQPPPKGSSFWWRFGGTTHHHLLLSSSFSNILKRQGFLAILCRNLVSFWIFCISYFSLLEMKYPWVKLILLLFCA